MDCADIEDTFTRQWIRCRHVGCAQSWVFRVGEDAEAEANRVQHEAMCVRRPLAR